MQRIVFEFPPRIDEIDAKFHCRDVMAIYSWGDVLYNPHQIRVGPELVAHEAMHGRRQLDDVNGWWDKYLADIEFRLAEEVLAHQAECKVLFDLYGQTRNKRRLIKANTVRRLRNPLYQFNISEVKAKSLLFG